MSDGAMMMIPLMAMGMSLMLAAAGGYYVYTQNKTTDAPKVEANGTPTPTPTPSPTPVPSLKSFSDGQKVLISTADGKYFSTKYDAKSKNTAKICSGVMTSTKTSATKMQLAKVGTSWQLRPDCDGDGKNTSYLTDEAADIVQKKISDKKKTNKQSWTIDCPTTTNGCTIRSVTTKRYLDSDGTAPTLKSSTAAGPSWIFETAT